MKTYVQKMGQEGSAIIAPLFTWNQALLHIHEQFCFEIGSWFPRLVDLNIEQRMGCLIQGGLMKWLFLSYSKPAMEWMGILPSCGFLASLAILLCGCCPPCGCHWYFLPLSFYACVYALSSYFSIFYICPWQPFSKSVISEPWSDFHSFLCSANQPPTVSLG